MEKKSLSKILNLKRTTKAIASVLRRRDRNPRNGITDIRRVCYDLAELGIITIPSDLIESFRVFEKSGLGEVLLEKDQPPRFKWYVNMKDALAHLEDHNYVPKPLSPPKEMPRTALAAPSSNEDNLTVVFESGRKFEMKVPSDLSEKEVKIIYETLLSKAHR